MPLYILLVKLQVKYEINSLKSTIYSPLESLEFPTSTDLFIAFPSSFKSNLQLHYMVCVSANSSHTDSIYKVDIYHFILTDMLHSL